METPGGSHGARTGDASPEAGAEVLVRFVTDHPGRHERVDRISGRDVQLGSVSDTLPWLDSPAASSPVVIVLDGLDHPDAILRLGASIDQRRPDAVTVLVAEASPEIFAAALRTGIRDLISPEAADKDIAEILERAASAALLRRPVADQQPAGGRPHGRVVIVTSPKGGSGKTTVATNLAVDLGVRFPSEVVVVDLDLQFGDVASCLRLEPSHTIVDAVSAVAADDVVLKSYLTAHSSGCYALCAPRSPGEAEKITADDVAALVRRLAASFRFVIIDTAPGLLEHTLAALEASDDVVFLAGMDVPSIRGLHRELGVLDELGLLDLRRHVVVNFIDRRSGLKIDDVAAMLGAKIDVQLPRSRAVPLSTNRGVPLLYDQARGPFARSLRSLINVIAEGSGGRALRRKTDVVTR